MNDILITIGIAVLFLSTIWIYERRLTSLEDLLVLQFTEPKFDTHARQAMAVANAAKAEASSMSNEELSDLLAPYSATTDTTLDDYSWGSKVVALREEQTTAQGFSQDEIDRYN